MSSTMSSSLLLKIVCSLRACPPASTNLTCIEHALHNEVSDHEYREFFQWVLSAAGTTETEHSEIAGEECDVSGEFYFVL